MCLRSTRFELYVNGRATGEVYTRHRLAAAAARDLAVLWPRSEVYVVPVG
jgi:hypothetical protein